MRSGDWTPDEIVLTIEAYFQIYREGADKDTTIAALAAELHRSTSSVEAAVDALKSADPNATGGPQLTVVAEALANVYLVPNRATQTARIGPMRSGLSSNLVNAHSGTLALQANPSPEGQPPLHHAADAMGTEPFGESRFYGQCVAVLHNEVMPHSAFRGQTPDEVYFGTGARMANVFAPGFATR